MFYNSVFLDIVMLSEDGSGEDDRDITEEAEGEILNDRKTII